MNNITVDKQAEKKINAIRAVVENRQAAKVEGQFLDLYSASAIVMVYDALSPESRLKYLSISLAGMADIAFNLLKKAV